MIAIIDYGMGNLRSVAKALEAQGAKNVKVTSSAALISKADKIVLPGVGAAVEAMQELENLRLSEVIKKNIFKKPFLGICLGLQLLFTESQEGGKVRGLGILKGKVRRFSEELKVPHMGWNQIKIKNQKSKIKNTNQKSKISNPFFKNIPDNSYFYFCHSYYVIPEDKSIIIATTDYGREFVSAVAKDNLFACQFHPEKSQRVGLRLLENFVKV